MNALQIEPPAAPDSRAAASFSTLPGGALLAYAVEIPAGEDPGALAVLLHALGAERERVAGLLSALSPEEIAHLLADLLNRLSGTPAACGLALAQDGFLHVLAAGGAAVYLAPRPSASAAGPAPDPVTGPAPVRKVAEGALSFLLPGAASLANVSTAAARRFHAADVVRLPLARESQVVLVSGEIEPTLEERLLAALQTSPEPPALDALLRGPVERAGRALVAFIAPGVPIAVGVPGAAPEARDGFDSEIGALRREVERRLLRLDGRLKEIEDLVLGSRSLQLGRGRFALPSLPALPLPKLNPRRPLPGSTEDLASNEDGPAFERGLDVPVASNWSRTLLLVTGGITLVLFLSIQLFCPTVPRRRLPPASKGVPATATAPKTPAASPKPPVGVLLVTPTSEPEGTEGTAPPRR